MFQILSTRRTGFQEFFGTLGHANNNLLCEIKKSFFDTLNILCSVFFHPPLDTLFDSPFLSALIALFRGSSRSIFLILFDTLFFGGEIIFEIDWKISKTLTRFKSRIRKREEERWYLRLIPVDRSVKKRSERSLTGPTLCPVAATCFQYRAQSMGHSTRNARFINGPAIETRQQ